jgi:hypothetical protein
METGKVMDGWSVKEAWVHCYGDSEFPPAHVGPESGKFSDVDHVVAACFGDVSEESLRKAHAAVSAIYPRLVLSQLPPSGFSGRSLKRHIAATTIEAMKKYRKQSGVLLREIKEDIGHIREWNLKDVGDWFYVYDSLGSTGACLVDSDMNEFYRFARQMWNYGKSE